MIDLNREEEVIELTFMGEQIEIHRIGYGGDLEIAKSLILQYDGKVDAIALEGMPAELQPGRVKKTYAQWEALRVNVRKTPVVDGSGVRAGQERWGVTLADRVEPGIFSEKPILMVPGLNHVGPAKGCAIPAYNPAAWRSRRCSRKDSLSVGRYSGGNAP